eukprot:3471473-Pyramimonas_sp.AAC.1
MGPRHSVLGLDGARGLQHWDLRWSSLWGHEALYWVGGTHASGSTGAAGGAPNGATKRCAAWGGAPARGSTGAVGGAPYVATKR